MNILDAYFPLFSHAAHGTPPDACARLAEQARGAVAARLAGQTETAPESAAKTADAAWFAVRAWRDGKTNTAAFKARLDALLLRAASGAATAETLDLLRLHTLCLELDPAAPENARPEKNRARYLRHCRNVLDAAGAPAAENPRRRTLRRVLRAALLLLAPAATAGLYCLYRAWLQRLLADVAG